jgi:transcriptional regulator with GAF, ATPase, and Fis domain
LSCQFTIALLDFEMSLPFKALNGLHETLNNFRAYNNKRDLCDNLLQLARVQFFVGFRKEAFSHLRFALWTAEEHRLQHLQGLCHWQLFQEELREGHLQDAQIQVEAALKTFQEIKLPQLIYKAEIGKTLLNYLQHTESTSVEELTEHVDKLKQLTASSTLDIDLLEIIILLVENGMEQLGHFSLNHWLENKLTDLSPRNRLQAIRALWLLNSHNETSTLSNKWLQQYLEELKQVWRQLPPSMRDSWMQAWHFDEVTNMIATPLEFSKIPATKKTNWQPLIQLLYRITQSNGKNIARSSLIQQLLKALSNLQSQQRVILCLNFNSRPSTLLEQLGVEQEAPKIIPNDFLVIGLNEFGKRFSPRRDPLLTRNIPQLQHIREPIYISNQQGSDKRSILMVPLSQKQSDFGFIYLDHPDSEVYSAEAIQLIAVLAHQISQQMAVQHPVTVPESALTSPKRLPTSIAVEPFSSQKKNPKKPTDFDLLVCESESMQNLKKIMRAMIHSDSTLLIEGESGSGKELIVDILFAYSPRRLQPFLKIDCGSISDDLFDASFFGYQKGSFTGAYEDRPGYFQTANHGTILLDNIDMVSLKNQAKLLRVIQNGEVRRLGAIPIEKIDVRIIALTAKSLAALVANSQFRADLFYRLDILHLKVPPLRERTHDIPKLIEIAQKNLKGSKFKISDEAMRTLLAYPWPGNVRELMNELERLSVSYHDKKIIDHDALATHIAANHSPLPVAVEKIRQQHGDLGLAETLKEVEKRLIQAVLKRHENNFSRTAETLKLSRGNLRQRMSKLGLMTKSSAKR